jgi:hypothetical protein
MYSFNVYNLGLGIGDSMYPTFSNCTLLVINPNIQPEELIKGNIVVINISDIQIPNLDYDLDRIAHRGVENNKIERWVSIKGDNEFYYDYVNQIDGKFGYDKVLGKIVFYTKLKKSFCEDKIDT